jgi:hypothetical protein
MADSVVVTFNLPDKDTVIKSLTTTDATALKKLIEFIDGKPDKPNDCGYDGNLLFYKKGQLLAPVIFKYTTPDCRHFLIEQEGVLISTPISSKAAAFLQDLSK